MREYIRVRDNSADTELAFVAGSITLLHMLITRCSVSLRAQGSLENRVGREGRNAGFDGQRYCGFYTQEQARAV